jgi:predicted CXXCH cytochrome family protein
MTGVAEETVHCAGCHNEHASESAAVAKEDDWILEAGSKTDPPTWLCPGCQEKAHSRRNR